MPEDLDWCPVVMVGPAPYMGFESALDSIVAHGWNCY
jgi:hypothetical protein